MRSWTLSFDLTSVLVFVGIGRGTHDSGTDVAGYVEVAAPFVIALTVGWVVMRAWNDPISLNTGAGVVGVTVAGGMLLRGLVFDGGTATSFIIVATAFLALLILGWRLVARRWV